VRLFFTKRVIFQTVKQFPRQKYSIGLVLHWTWNSLLTLII